jgi:glycerol uptake facilitator-like aquaporin
MSYHKYAAELLGAFTLTFVVWLSVTFSMPFATPIMAALTLGLFVYTIGGISGAHLNPAVTIGMLSAGKIKTNDAVFYVICQLAGAAIAMTVEKLLSGQMAVVPYATTLNAGIAEAIGAFFLAFGVMSATLQKVAPAAAGLAVGGSLLLGIYVAFPFSNAILNPAVALGIGAFGPMEILGPIVGAVGGAWVRLKLDAKA